MPGTGLITWAMDYKVDRVRTDVAVTLLGLARSRAGLSRGSRLLCRPGTCGRRHNAADGPTAAGIAARDRRTIGRHACQRAACLGAGSRLCRTRSAAIPPHQGGRRGQGRAVLSPSVMRRTLVSIRRSTAFSATKSVTSALIGVLVRKGDACAPFTGPRRRVAGPRRSQACHHGRSVAAPYRGPGAWQLALGVARRCVRAGQSHEIHRRRQGRLC